MVHVWFISSLKGYNGLKVWLSQLIAKIFATYQFKLNFLTQQSIFIFPFIDHG